MTTVTNTFNRVLKPQVTTGVSILAGNVATGMDMVVTGLIVANTGGVNTNVSIAITNGATTCYLIKDSKVPPTESLIAIGWDQKVVLKSGDNLVVTSSGAPSDVVLSTLEITTA
jgi:hypothetical protein